MARADEDRWLGMRRDITALTPEWTFESTFPGRAIQERVLKVEGKVNGKHGGEQLARSPMCCDREGDAREEINNVMGMWPRSQSVLLRPPSAGQQPAAAVPSGPTYTCSFPHPHPPDANSERHALPRELPATLG